MKILKIVDCSFRDNGLILPDDLTLNNIELFLVNIGKVGSIQNAMQDFEISHLLSITPNLIKFTLEYEINEYNDLCKTICDYSGNPNLTKSLQEMTIFAIVSHMKHFLIHMKHKYKHSDTKTFELSNRLYRPSRNTVSCIKDFEDEIRDDFKNMQSDFKYHTYYWRW